MMKEKIKAWLKDNDKSQAWLSRKMDIDRANFNYYMANRDVRDWPVWLAGLIKDATGIDVTESG